MWLKPDRYENFFVSCLKATGIDSFLGKVPYAPANYLYLLVFEKTGVKTSMFAYGGVK